MWYSIICFDVNYHFKYDLLVFTGIFAPVSKIAKPGSTPAPRPLSASSPSKSPNKNVPVDVSNVKARVDTGSLFFQQYMLPSGHYTW